MRTGTIGDVQISVKTLNGDCFTVNVPRLEKIIDLKNKIAMETGLIPCDQILIYGGILLHGDDMKIDEYSVLNGSVINVVARLRGGMQIFARTMDGRTVAIQVQKTERIIDVKKKIQEKIGLPPEEQKLVFQEVLLKDDKTVEEYHIEEKSVINIVARLRVRNGMQILVEIMNGSIVSINVQKTDRIIDVNKKIQAKIGRPTDEQKLMFQGKILEDNKTVEECKIEENSVINVVVGLRGGIQIFAKLMDGRVYSIEVQKTDRMIDVKKEIQDKIGLPPEEQKLVFQGEILEDDKRVEECKIEESLVIKVLFRLRNGIEIFAKTMKGKNVLIEVLKTDRIIDVKKKIQEMIGLAPEQQKMMFLGELLKDDKIVEECEIREKSVIKIASVLKNEMVLFAQTNDGGTHCIIVGKTVRIFDLKNRIKEETGIDTQEMVLIYHGFVLEDERFIDECGIIKGSVIEVYTKLKFDMKINVRTNKGRNISIDTNKTEQMSILKRKIQSQTGLECEQQMLMLDRIILEDEKTVKDCQLIDGSTVLVVIE